MVCPIYFTEFLNGTDLNIGTKPYVVFYSGFLIYPFTGYVVPIFRF